ncbi:hypothetical protein SOVF_096060 isoform A [Spinacia oleracea]|nr:hypothetical protein SOVF_096060 isoform A [Spinacia oleracea]
MCVEIKSSKWSRNLSERISEVMIWISEQDNACLTLFLERRGKEWTPLRWQKRQVTSSVSLTPCVVSLFSTCLCTFPMA